MTLFNFKKTIPDAIPKSTVQIFDRQIALRYVKGQINNYSIQEWTRYYDTNGNIVRYGDGADDDIIRSEKYKMLELRLKTIAYDSYMSPGHHEKITSLYFEKDSLFDGFSIGDTISYFGLFLKEGASWTNYFILNHSKDNFTNLYFPETINRYIFYNKLNVAHLATELENKIKQVEIQ
jgi:hypothetical protein